MSLLFLEQDQSGLAYEELVVSVLGPWFQHVRTTSIRKGKKKKEENKKLWYILDSIQHS